MLNLIILVVHPVMCQATCSKVLLGHRVIFDQESYFAKLLKNLRSNFRKCVTQLGILIISGLSSELLLPFWWENSSLKIYACLIRSILWQYFESLCHSFTSRSSSIYKLKLIIGHCAMKLKEGFSCFLLD